VTVAQIRKLKRIAAERGYPLIPGHDPVAWPALTRELAARWPAASRRLPRPRPLLCARRGSDLR
jgi:glyoxylase-like metal-dependent hydrolase (beta-lactamase superfamily II)